MFRHALLAATLAPLVLSVACKNDDEEGTPPLVEGSGLARFEGAWAGVDGQPNAFRSEGGSFTSECRFNYVKASDVVRGQIDLDGIWNAELYLGEGGSYVLSAVPIVDGNTDVITFTDVEFVDDTYQSFSVNWKWDYTTYGEPASYTGTALYTKYDLNAAQ